MYFFVFSSHESRQYYYLIQIMKRISDLKSYVVNIYVWRLFLKK